MSTTFAASDAGKALTHALETRPEVLVAAAQRIHHSPWTAQRQTYSDAEIQQMCGGFSALLREAIAGERSDVRTMVMDTMIPGLVARGETVDSIVHWNAGFMVLLACELVRVLPEAARDGATDWLFGFTGSYVVDVGNAARGAVAAKSR